MSFDQDPTESVTLSGADFAQMMDEIQTLKDKLANEQANSIAGWERYEEAQLRALADRMEAQSKLHCIYVASSKNGRVKWTSDSRRGEAWLVGVETGEYTYARRYYAEFAQILRANHTDGEYKSLFLAAIRDLAEINKRLNLDPDDGGAVPIIEAIDEMERDLQDCLRCVAESKPVARVTGVFSGQHVIEPMDKAVVLQAGTALFRTPPGTASKIASLEAPVEAVAEIGSDFTLFWVGTGAIAPIIRKHNLKVGDKLYTKPFPASAPAGVPDGWQPIETAPKDGETAFLGYQSLPNGLWIVAPMYLKGEVWALVQFHTDNTEHEMQPTHWMSLPAAPATQDSPAQGEKE